MCYLCDDVVPGRLDGDPARVRAHARAFDDTAEALRDAARELRNLANEGVTISLAIDEVRDKAEESHSEATKVATRYAGAGSTLGTYADALADAQSRADSARTQIDSNNSNGRYWRHRRRDLEQERWTRGSDPEFLEDLAEATRRAAQYDTWFAGYLSSYQQAVEDFETAVNNAISGLSAAAEAAGLNDGFFEGIVGDFQVAWETISKYLGPVIEALRDVLEVLKKIVDILALIVTIAAIFFPALAPLALALTALSAILGIAIFACSLALFAMGRESLGRVLADGIMAVVGVVTAKLGGSGTLTGMVRGGFSTLGQGSALFVTRGTAIQLGLLVEGQAVVGYGQAVSSTAIDGIKSGYLNANATPFAFVLGEGLDFTLGQSSPAWGAEPSPAWSMEGANGTDIIPGVMDGPGLGTVSPIAGLFDMSDSWNSMIDNFGETADVWGDISAVPAT
jgi:hypothetical protein